MRLQVTATGLTALEEQRYVFGGSARRTYGRGDSLLTSSGYLVDSSNLTLKLNLGSGGSPWLDGAKNRAYLVDGKNLRSFDTTTGMEVASLALPTTGTGDWSLSCTRWGADGMAILGGTEKSTSSAGPSWEASTKIRTEYRTIGKTPISETWIRTSGRMVIKTDCRA